MRTLERIKEMELFDNYGKLAHECLDKAQECLENDDYDGYKKYFKQSNDYINLRWGIIKNTISRAEEGLVRND